MKIICIGRNYADHIAELNNEKPEEPVIFMKPDSSILRKNKPFFIPNFSTDLHHEVELVLKIDQVGKNISPKFASRYYSSVGLGIDFTARDLQNKLKDKGLPWEKAKAFDYSAVISSHFIPLEQLSANQIEFRLDINGTTRQTGNSALMIFSFDELIANVSKYFTLKTGDLIYTGTPAGVGPVKINDRLQGYIGNKLMFDFMVK
ncbi:MAG TPA: fumarylacetoacetate hydrolase family protein [Prolixibacteraceae bacterium]|nr:fumarylacetoacetate hydrolase family protein [Prolixibacteraceae bacterium]